MADFYQLLGLIKEKYPQIFGILNQPGVFKVAMDIVNAESNQQPWSTAQIEAAMAATEYGQTTNIKKRAWDALQALDPATAKTKATNTKAVIDDLKSRFGIQLDQTGGFNSIDFKFFTDAVQQDWDPDQIKYHLLASVNEKPTGGGELGEIAGQVKKTFDDWGVPISDQGVMGWATKVGSGALTADAITGYAQQQARSLFPSLTDAIDRGITVRQYADPYLQIAQQELGIDPKNVSLTDPKWQRAINQVDSKTGARTAMNLSDWTSTVRSDPLYGYDKTTKAKTAAADFANRLGQMMGAQ